MSRIGFWQEWAEVGLKSCLMQDSTFYPKKKNRSFANICLALRVSHDDYIKSSGRSTTQLKYVEHQAWRFVEQKVYSEEAKRVQKRKCFFDEDGSN